MSFSGLSSVTSIAGKYMGCEKDILASLALYVPFGTSNPSISSEPRSVYFRLIRPDNVNQNRFKVFRIGDFSALIVKFKLDGTVFGQRL